MNLLQDASAGFHPTRRLVIIGIMVLLAVLLPITVVAAVLYMTWQTSPEKVLADAAAYAHVTPATYHVTSGTDDVTVRYDGTRLAATGVYGGLRFDSVINNRVAYVKTPTPEKLISAFTSDTLPASVQPLVNTVTKLVTNRWVSASFDQLPFGKAAGSNDVVCVQNADDQLTANANAANELAQTYMAHQFMHITTAKTGDTVAYDITFDVDKTKSFWDALEKTQYYQSLSTDCANVLHLARTADMEHSAIRLVLDDKTHAVQSAQITQPHKQQVIVAVTYGKQTAIAVPTDALSYDSITNGIWQSVFKSGLSTNSR